MREAPFRSYALNLDVRPSVRPFVRSFVRATPTVTFLWFPPCACLLGFKISGLVPWLGGCDPFFGRGHSRASNLVFWFFVFYSVICETNEFSVTYRASVISRSVMCERNAFHELRLSVVVLTSFLRNPIRPIIVAVEGAKVSAGPYWCG